MSPKLFIEVDAAEKLGKKYKVGDVINVTTKKMTPKNRRHIGWNDEKWEVLRQGDVRIFQKGKRKYVCMVHGLIETRTGVYQYGMTGNKFYRWLRWYMFTYEVKIIEN